MNKIYFLWCLLLLLPYGLDAQGRGQWKGKPGGGGPKAKIPVKGKIVDGNSKQGLEFATITLFSMKDSSVVTGGITDEKGQFLLESRPGRFFAKIEFISYRSKIIPDIRIPRESLDKNLGTITLDLDAETLSEVEVRAEKSQMQMSLDKKVFNVGKDLANRGGTAADILDNVPSVTVDIEGNVELRGSGNVRLLVDGKPSGLLSVDNANGLRQLPSNLIERIEVITNPSARYEAEGMAGIINIVLRKEKGGGLNGSFDFTLGYPSEYGAAINLNYRKKNFNFFTNYGIGYRRAPGGGNRHQEFNPDSDSIQVSDQIRDMERGGWSNSIRLGADYYFNDKNVLTTSFLYKTSSEDNFTELEYRDFLKTAGSTIPTELTKRTDTEIEDEDKVEYALNYKKTFDRKGQELMAVFTYQDNTEEESSDFVSSFFNPDGTPSNLSDLQQQSANKEGENVARLQVDYVHPFSKDSKFEIGGLTSIRTIKNDYVVEEWVENKWEQLVGLTNQFRYDEDIYAMYAIYGNKHRKLSYQIGLRAEYSDVRTELIQNDSINARNYINPFPSAHISYDLPKQNSIQLSYSRRIRRPRFWDLNPFFTFSDNQNFFSGNPDLDPELTNSLELSHIKYFGKGSISSSLYYRHTNDVIQRIREFNTEDQTTFTQPKNLASRDDMGLEFTFSYNPQKWMRFNGNLNFFRSITEGEEFGRADTYSWFARMTNKMTLWKQLDVQTTFNYRAPRETTQGRRRAMWTINLGLSKDILKKKGTLTLSARDLFNTRRRMWTVEDVDFFEEGDFQWRSRQITLNLNYRLNQNKRRGRRSGGYQGGEGGEF